MKNECVIAKVVEEIEYRSDLRRFARLESVIHNKPKQKKEKQTPLYSILYTVTCAILQNFILTRVKPTKGSQPSVQGQNNVEDP